MDELEGGGGGQHRRGVGAAAARRGQREHRADALAAGEQRVAHRLDEARGAPVGAEVERDEVVLDELEEVGGVRVRPAADRGIAAAASAGDATETLEEAAASSTSSVACSSSVISTSPEADAARRGSSSSSWPMMARTRATAAARLERSLGDVAGLSHRRPRRSLWIAPSTPLTKEPASSVA